jgi:hypothetical protein
MRKHRSQMNGAEIEALESFIHTRVLPNPGGHADGRMQQKGVSTKELDRALECGNVIEIHKEAWEVRALVRHEMVCVVVGLESKATVTTWKNALDDNHSTIDMTPYTWQVDACRLVN